MLTTANHLVHVFATYSEKLQAAEDWAIKTEQDYENESTVFYFEDGSKAIFESVGYTINYENKMN